MKRLRRPPPLHLRRQVPIGRSPVDVRCLKAKLVIAVDGHRHGTDAARECDQARTVGVESEGFRVLRFANADARTDIDSVLDTIAAALPSAQNPISRNRPETQPHG